VTLERAERGTYLAAIATLRERLGEEREKDMASADLEALIAIEQGLDEFDAGLRPFGPAAVSGKVWEVLREVDSGEGLLEMLVPDPRRHATLEPPMSLDTAAAIVEAFQEAGAGSSGFAQMLADLPRADRDDLLNTVWRRYEERHDPIPHDQCVGVLLPLRLETRFVGPVHGVSWTLQLRVFPEEASLDREPGPPTPEEAAHTAAMWKACGGDLRSGEGKAAFGDLIGRVGGARAAWLARALPPGSDEEGAEGRSRRFSRPRGLPPSLQVWLERGGAPELVEQLSPDSEAIAAEADLGQLYTGVEDPDGPPPETWLTSFERAKDVGLAAEIDIGPDPEGIDALYVIGLGEGEPAELLRGHADSGRLAVLAPGTPTNSVAGEEAADLGRDPELWLQRAIGSGYDQPAVRALDLALCGGAHLGPLAGGDLDLCPAREALTSALFPVLLGRALKDQWGAGVGTWDLWRWVRRCLAPEGAFPTIRVADQPYGVLPVTRLLPRLGFAEPRWVPHPADPRVEEALVRVLVELLPRWARAAEEDGNVVGADTGRLLGLLGRTPVSAAWARRTVLAVDLLRALGFAYGAGGFVERLERTWREEVEEGDPPLRSSVRRLIPFGEPTWLESELLEGASAGALRRMLQATNADLLSSPDPQWFDGNAPTPLLARLLRHALVLTNAELSRALDPDFTGSWKPPLMPPIESPEQLASLAWEDRRHPAVQDDQRRIDVADEGGPDITESDTAVPEIARIARGWEAVRDGAEALASGELDDATVDRGLRALLDSSSHRLDPWASGVASRRLRWLQSRGASWRLGAYGWVDAPGPAQGEELQPGPTAAGLLHAPSHAQALTAAILRDHAVRQHDTARWEIALDSEKVRAAERLAGEVRAGVHVKEALGRLVEEIVGDPAVVNELRRRPAFQMRPEHEGRRVCDGEAVVHAAVYEPAALPAEVPVEEIKALQDVLDTYADLLVADGVFDVVSGRPEAAAEAMEAAAGLGPPSDLRVLRTPREGTALSTVVLVVLTDDAPADPAAPGAIADPLFAALLERETGDPAAVAWRWDVTGTEVSLADLGLAPVDALTVPAGALAARVRKAADPSWTPNAPQNEQPPPLGEPPALATARELAELLAGQAGSSPALLDPEPEAAAAVAAAAAQDLRARAGALRAAAEALVARLETAPSAAAIAEAERWGVEGGAGAESERAAAAAAELAKRVEDDKAAADDEDSLVGRLRALAGAAALPAVWRVPRAALDVVPADGARLREHEAPALDEEWLTVTAAVRPPLARLEAWQLARGAGPWRAWSTHAGDPWRATWLAANAGDRKAAPSEQAIAYGVAAAFEKERVGVVLLDRFAETAPSSSHTTSAAFGFNGPKARAPQSILLAVPPDVNEPLDEETLVEILAETRLLARARMATPEALAAHRIPLPTTLLLGWRDEGRGERGEARYPNVDLERVDP
jgi:hypothetical protein